jgi:hypothetical protein
MMAEAWDPREDDSPYSRPMTDEELDQGVLDTRTEAERLLDAFSPGEQTVGTPTEPFKHAPCLSCETEGYESAGQDPAYD